MLSFKERANWTPAEARAQFRQNFFPFVQSGGIAAPYTQVSVHFVPSAEAKLFAEFCRLNHAPCPVVYKSEPGQVTAPPIAADLDIRQVIVYYIYNYNFFGTQNQVLSHLLSSGPYLSTSVENFLI